MIKEVSALQLYAPWFGHATPIHFNGNYMPNYKDNFENMFRCLKTVQEVQRICVVLTNKSPSELDTNQQVWNFWTDIFKTRWLELDSKIHI